MLQLKKTNEFSVTVNFSLPGNGTDVVKPASFVATFRSLPKQELEDVRGLIAAGDPSSHRVLFQKALVSVEGVSTDDKDDDGNVMTPLEVVTQNQFTSAALFNAFWETVNRDINAKNAKTSPKR